MELAKLIEDYKVGTWSLLNRKVPLNVEEYWTYDSFMLSIEFGIKQLALVVAPPPLAFPLKIAELL